MAPRSVEVFFYGLFMDRELLEGKGFRPTDTRIARVRGFALRIGARAALVPDPASEVHGVLMKLTHAELERLYAEPGVRGYLPEAVLAVTSEGAEVPALCYNLATPPAEKANAEYAGKLRALAERVGLPARYEAGIR
jgi:hypothetical protein